MSSSLLDLNGVKDLFIKGLKHAKKKWSSIFFGRNDDLIDYQIELAKKAKNMTEMGFVMQIANPTFENAFWNPDPICPGCELQKTPIQFGYSNTGWYFVYAVVGPWCYNITLFRQEIAPPDVVDFSDRNQAVRWLVLGGYGKVGGEWYSMQSDILYLEYTQPTFSTFSLQGSGATKTITFSSSAPMQFSIDLKFTDKNGQNHTLQSELVSTLPPINNFSQSNPAQKASLYYSYTNLSTTIKVGEDNKSYSGGNAWIDHQLITFAQPSDLYTGALLGVINTFDRKKSRGWLWTSVQDFESGLQYMFCYFYPRDKYYSEAVSKNQVFKEKDIPLINVYKEGVGHYNPTEVSMDSSCLRMEIIETYAFQGVNLPSAYAITLPGGKKVILRAASAANIYDSPICPYECPSILYDESGQKQIGIGLIEANFYLDNPTLARRMIQYSGGDPTDKNGFNQVMNGLVIPQSGWQKVLAFMVLLSPLFIIAALLVFILYRKDQRHIRFMITIILVLLAFAMLKRN